MLFCLVHFVEDSTTSPNCYSFQIVIASCVGYVCVGYEAAYAQARFHVFITLTRKKELKSKVIQVFLVWLDFVFGEACILAFSTGDFFKKNWP